MRAIDSSSAPAASELLVSRLDDKPELTASPLSK
jgi:hypothetical protein